MKAMKKAVSIVLTLCLVLSMLAVAAVSVSAEEEDVYVITGSSDWLDNWSPNVSVNVMSKQEDGTYAITVANVQPGTANYQFKVVKYAGGDVNQVQWIGSNGTDYNYEFMVKQACDVTVTFNHETNEINVTGEGVGPAEYPIDKITAVGSGQGNFLNGVSWDPKDESNKMDEVAPRVYEITYYDVDSNTEYQFKFAANGDWGMNWGSDEPEVNVNTTYDAYYNSGSIYFYPESDVDYVSVTLKLDLTNWNSSTKTGATFTILVDDGEEPSSEEPSSAEPTTAEPTTVEPATVEPTTVEPSDAYYLVKNTDEWEISNDRKFTINPANQSEYVLNNVALDNGEEFKVVDVYFRPDGQGSDDWHYHTIFATECSVKGKTLSVGGGDIAVNFYFANKPDTVTFSWNGMADHDADAATVIYDNSMELYKATCRVAAPEMGDEITAKYSFDNGTTAFTTTTSVKECAEAYISGNFEQDVKDLAQAMLNYGAAAQKQFTYKTDDLVADISGLATLTKDDIKLYVNGAQKDESSVTPSGAILAKNAKLADYNLQYAGCSLMMKSNTTLRFYFRATDADAGINTNDITLYLLNGEQAHLNESDQTGVYYVEQTDIGACQLGAGNSLWAGDDDTDENGFLGDYCALSYVKLALGSDKADDTLKTTVSALYNYYAAASVWHDNHSVLNA